jgi:hypothetical protein
MLRTFRVIPLLFALCFWTPACHRAHRDAPPAPETPAFVGEPAVANVLIVVESEGPGGPSTSESARALETLIAHFEEWCALVAAADYTSGQVGRYSHAFYVAGKPDGKARASFAADATDHEGTIVWVGPGLQTLGRQEATGIQLRAEPRHESAADAQEWLVSYRDQRHFERVSVPAVATDDSVRILAEAARGAERRPFIAEGVGHWYVATGPKLEQERFWSTAVWADALHEMMARPHEGQRRLLVPVLRDVPIWATPTQVPRVIRPLLEAGIPVGVLAWTNWGDVPLADRPDAVDGLRQAESMGATVALASDTGLDVREHFRLAWEVGLHPIAWVGDAGRANPFRLRVVGRQGSPPFCAGGMLPAPITISDAGYIDPQDAARLDMQEVIRDAVALVSFGLWAPSLPFQSFLEKRVARGWQMADLRDLGVRVDDPRRALISGEASVRVAPGVRLRKKVFDPNWQRVAEEVVTNSTSDVADLSLAAPKRSVTMLEVGREAPASEFIKGVTLDPWAYSGSTLASRSLAEALAERYMLNGVNTVFFYVYNVEQGAAYRTRYRGASVSRWGKSDLLAHLLEACHSRDIRVVAWLYSGRDKRMWNKHPGWRERTKSGKEHNPLRLHAAYFLCPRNPDVRRWFAGLLRDLARRYPTLDGIELCEPVVNWFGNQACYCEVCQREFARAHPDEPTGGAAWRTFRADGLTEFLSSCMQPVVEQDIETYVMTISDALSNGAILSPRRQADESGFDLEALLDSPYPPDWINFEIIWQQWAAIYGTEVFNYDWAVETASRLLRRTDGRSRVLLHVELTDFGTQKMTPQRIAETVRRLKVVEADGVECYDSAAIDEKAAWPVLKHTYGGLP